MRRFWQLLPPVLVLAVIAGAAAGTVLGWADAASGFPLLLFAAVARGVRWTVLGAVVFLAIFVLVTAALRGRVRAWMTTALAAGVAAAPFVALAGYRLNRVWGVRPSEILEPYALKHNLALLAGCFLLCLPLAYLLHRWSAAAPRPGARPVVVTAAVALLTLALDAAVFTAFRVAPAGPRPNVLILLIDALRADHVGAYGYPRDTTPTLDALARDGVTFRQAISQSTFTKSSIASLFTGRYPYQHGVYWGNLEVDPATLTSDVLPARETTLAEALAERGYLTTAWVQNSHLRPFMGFAQGFVRYRDNQGSIERIHRGFLPWLRGPGRRYGFFTYLHYIDLHDPYQPPPPYDTRFGTGRDVYAGIDLSNWGAYLEGVRQGSETLAPEVVSRLADLYDGQLRRIDDQIAHLVAELKRLGLYDDTLLIVTADHGDGFMEHGFISHSTTPYEELVRVPLIVKLPQSRYAGREVTAQVRLVDVLPTVLAAVDAEPPADLAGCSLLPLLEGGDASSRDPRCTEAVIEIAEEGADPILALRTEQWKYIHHQHRPPELYDLAVDPSEKTNLADTRPEVAAEMAARAQEILAQRPAPGERLELDDRAIRDLKTLGYVGD